MIKPSALANQSAVTNQSAISTGIVLCGVLITGLASPVMAQANDAATPWYWHYAPLDGLTHGIGVSRPHSTQAAPWQVRLNVGYDLDALGGTLQLQQTLLDEHPQWYLASGLRVLHFAAAPAGGPCDIFDCDARSNQWQGTVYSRWTWSVTAENFRFDLGYGAQLQVREGVESNRLDWSLSPTLDAALGWRL